jgi:hypothetical protein
MTIDYRTGPYLSHLFEARRQRRMIRLNARRSGKSWASYAWLLSHREIKRQRGVQRAELIYFEETKVMTSADWRTLTDHFRGLS